MMGKNNAVLFQAGVNLQADFKDLYLKTKTASNEVVIMSLNKSVNG